ncbi:MAG TPA: hypothetical protein DF712_14715 [Balneola sp.]|nr:hypothetical protein [Balneola sp.]|tara:strand:- start:10 stop:225 length:216 start_codon:yes stop_codon:yes gene_type:complete
MKSKHTNCYSCSTLDEVANELHQKIMNIPINERLFEYSQPFINAYKIGHRDARHAAAELVFQTIAEKTFPK